MSDHLLKTLAEDCYCADLDPQKMCVPCRATAEITRLREDVERWKSYVEEKEKARLEYAREIHRLRLENDLLTAQVAEFRTDYAGLSDDYQKKYEELIALRKNRDDWMAACKTAQEHRDGANAQLETLESEYKGLLALHRLCQLQGITDSDKWRGLLKEKMK